jgi:uncharacterized protein (TIGR00369 family)
VQNPFGLHLRFENIASGEVEVRYTVPERYQGYPGVVHGGVVAAMLDEVASRTHMEGDPPRFMYTARLEIRYRQNVPIGQPLRIVGRAVKSKARTATANGTIYDQNSAILAEADVLLVNVPSDVVGSVDLEELGWRVYEDEEIG